MLENINEQPIDNSKYTHFVGVKFSNTPRAYFFGITEELQLHEGDKVVVETMRGLEMGEIVIAPISMEKYDSELGLKPVLRIASDIDIKMHETNAKDARFALDICDNEAKKLNLKMNLISCEYTLDKTKVIFSASLISGNCQRLCSR